MLQYVTINRRVIHQFCLLLRTALGKMLLVGIGLLYFAKRNETKPLRNETKRNRCETKRNETAAKRNETAAKRNQISNAVLH